MNDDIIPMPPNEDPPDYRVDDLGEPVVDPMPLEPTDAPVAPDVPEDQ